VNARLSILAAALLAAGGARAAEPVEAAGATAARSRPVSGFVEAGAGYHGLSDGYRSWSDQHLRSFLSLTELDALDLEVSHQAHFGDRGTFFGAGYTRILDERWYARVAAGASAGGVFLPRARVDGSLSRKWLDGGALVTTVGAGYARSRDVHWDGSGVLEAAYWFRAPFVVSAGTRLNVSNPRSVVTARGFGAVAYGREKRHWLTLRLDAGEEGYQVVGEGAVLSRFSSTEAAAIWRQWITGSVGFDLQLTRYVNPSYTRSGAQLGVFWDF
jgi:YaiO family outer membrane protein